MAKNKKSKFTIERDTLSHFIYPNWTVWYDGPPAELPAIKVGQIRHDDPGDEFLFVSSVCCLGAEDLIEVSKLVKKCNKYKNEYYEERKSK